MVRTGFSYAEEGPEADLTVDAWGGSLGEAFGNAARALFNAITPIEGVRAQTSRAIEAEGDDLGSLLFNFLDELLYIHDIDLLVFSEFDVEVDEEGLRVRAECRGERFDVGRHEQGIMIKAVTFHDMRIGRADGGWAVRVVFDT
jgi:SHS2 domain-containing protein